MELHLWCACSFGNSKAFEVRLLLEKQINPNWQNDEAYFTTPFWIACFGGHLEVVKLLLNDNRVDVNKANKNEATPFLIACKEGHQEVVKLLLNDKRIDINKADDDGWAPFYSACYNGHVEIVKYLLESGREIDINKKDKNGKTGLDWIREKGNTDIVNLIESFQNNPNETRTKLRKELAIDEQQLWKASFFGNIEGAQKLLQSSQIDTNWQNYLGETPFYIACRDGHIEVVKILLNDQRVDINKADNYGWAPFHISCKNGHIDVVKLLLNDDRVQINKTTKDGATPFHIACLHGHIEIMKLLLNEKRISIRKKTNYGSTALDIAKENNHSEIVKLIKEVDTEQQYREYLRTLQSLVHIKNETINKQDFLILNEYLKKNKNIKELKFRNCGLTSPNILDILKTLIWKYENLQLSNLQSIEIDDIKLESTEGLEIIPIEIRNQGTKSIVQYILDLCKSPNSNPLYRTKLMVVGYENVGKTTILDCLFPILDFGETKGKLGRNEYLIELQGKYFRKYKPKELNKVYKEIILENKQWNVQEIKETGLELIPLNDKNQKKIEIYFEDKETRDKWIERLKRVALNVATHGIEVNNHVWNSSTLNQFQNNNLGAKQNGNEEIKHKDKDDQVEFSTWDFAGQNDYYNTHHYFLSNRSIFLVLYRMDKGIKGLESLDFWLKSLSSHLNQNYCDDNGKPYYSIIIIGTFLDSIINDNQNDKDKNLRQTKAMEIYDKNGLKSPPFYFEVSCSTLENIEELREIIFNTSLSHSYMGENVPIGYLTIEKSIYELRKLKQDHPIIEIQDLFDHIQSQYQSQSFDIEFTILGDLFKADESIRQLRSNGIIDYSQVNKIWNGPSHLVDTYLSLLQKFEVCFIIEEQQNENQKKLIIPNLLSEDKTKIIEEKLEKKRPETVPRGEIEIERIFSFNQVPSEMVSRLLVRFHDKIVDNIIWRRGVLLKHFNKKNENENENVLCLLEVKMEENLFEIKIRGKERNKCLEMMKYIYEEVKIVSGNYGGVKWKECVRSSHFPKGLINLDDIEEDCKLELKDRKLICPITHFPIYGEELLFKTGLLDSLDNQNNIGNDYWNYSFKSLKKKRKGKKEKEKENKKREENQNQGNQKSETNAIFENSQKLNKKEYEKVEYLLNLFGFDLSRVDKVIGIENKNLKRSFEARGQQIYGQHKDTPNLFKKEDWIEQSEPELRKSFIQYLGDYISKFRQVGWNHGNNSFVIPMIQGTTEDAAWRICDNGFGTVCKIDAGYYSQGVYVTSKVEYAKKYCKGDLKVFVIGFVIVGNPFPVIEHPFMTNEKGKVVMQEIEKDKPKKNENGYLGKPINPGYQSHFTLVDGRYISTAFPITKVEQLNEKWIADELVVHESQTYPSYIIYSK